MTDRTYETLTPRLRQDYFKRLTEKRKNMRWTGWICIAVGVLAMLFPFAASLSINVFAGVLFIISGGVMLYHASSQPNGFAIAAAILFGLLTIAGGIVMILFPLIGLFWLTFMLAVFLLVEGGTQCYFAFKLRPADGWVWMLVSGIVAIVLGVLIALGLPGSSLVILGLFLGINLLMTGVALVVLASKLDPNKIIDQREETVADAGSAEKPVN